MRAPFDRAKGKVKGKPIAELAGGLSLLSCFVARAEPLAMAELVALTGLRYAETRRFVHTLYRLGYLHQCPTSDRYMLGPEALTFATRGISSRHLCDFAAPLMDELSEATDVSIALGVRHDLAMVCIETRTSRSVIALNMEIGMHLPLIDTAMGRAYLAACEEEERAALLQMIEEAAILPTPGSDFSFDRVLATNELLGACYSFGEWQPDINGIAIGFRPGHGLPTMAINCGAPAVYASSGYLLNEVRPRLAEIVDRIRQEFGQEFPGHRRC